MSDPSVNYTNASRNLWNLYALDHFNKSAFAHFTTIILKAKPEQLHTLDIANCLRAYSHFQYTDYDALELILKQCIARTSDFNMQSLAMVVNSLGELDVQNSTLLQLTKRILLNKIDLKAELGPRMFSEGVNRDEDLANLDQEQLIQVNNLSQKKNQTISDLKPIDCAMFVKAFTDAKMFREIELLESLQAAFLSKIDEASGEDLVAILIAHHKWGTFIVEQTIEKRKQRRRVYTVFKKYSDEVFERLGKALINSANQINVKGIFYVLIHGKGPYLKKRSNMRLMMEFGLKGLNALVRERNSMGKDFETFVVHYYQLLTKYCHNNYHLLRIQNEIKVKLDLDILEMVDKISPL